MKINQFIGEYRWLSNFWLTPIILDDVTYPSVENAYQAAKTMDVDARTPFSVCTPKEAKSLGRLVLMRSDWPNVKLTIMEELVRQKFNTDPLRAALIATGNAELIEGNHWNDTFWGVCRGVGYNHLGRILMRVRQDISGEKEG